MSSRQPSDFTKHLSDIDESDCDDPFFGDDSDEEIDKDDELEFPLEADDLQLIEQAAREEAGALAKTDDLRDRQMVTYNAAYEKLLRDAEFIARNRIAANTCAHYNRANVYFVKWIFFYARDDLLPKYIEMFQLALVNGEEKGLIEVIEKVVMEQEICPLKLDTFKAKTFFTYLLSFKTTLNRFFSYSCYDGKRSALIHLINLTDVLWSLKERKHLSDLMISPKKSIAKEKQELRLRTTEVKEAVSMQTYKLTCELLLKEGTKEAYFVLTWLTMQWNFH